MQCSGGKKLNIYIYIIGNIIKEEELREQGGERMVTMELKSFRDAVDFASDLGLFSVVFEHEFSWLHRELMNGVPERKINSAQL